MSLTSVTSCRPPGMEAHQRYQKSSETGEKAEASSGVRCAGETNLVDRGDAGHGHRIFRLVSGRHLAASWSLCALGPPVSPGLLLSTYLETTPEEISTAGRVWLELISRVIPTVPVQVYCPFVRSREKSFLLTHCHQIYIQKEISRPGFPNVNR